MPPFSLVGPQCLTLWAGCLDGLLAQPLTPSRAFSDHWAQHTEIHRRAPYTDGYKVVRGGTRTLARIIPVVSATAMMPARMAVSTPATTSS